MNTPPQVKLHLFFAADNDRAVILRTGPATRCRLILWHRDTGRFDDGQWLKHRVDPERCDLSPDGQHFIYYGLDGKWQSITKGSYTALSRPPYFTALSLFPVGNSWDGGGRFLDNALYVAVGDHDVLGRDEGLVRLHKGEKTKDCPHGLYMVNGQPAKVGKTKAAIAWETDRPRDPALDLYDTVGGVLYQRDGLDLVLIRDFTDMRFEEIRAPYDWRGGSDSDNPLADWHPLDDLP